MNKLLRILQLMISLMNRDSVNLLIWKRLDNKDSMKSLKLNYCAMTRIGHRNEHKSILRVCLRKKFVTWVDILRVTKKFKLGSFMLKSFPLCIQMLAINESN